VHEISRYLPLQSNFVFPAASAVVIGWSILPALILVPFAIAVHRFVLLGEVFDSRLLQINLSRYKRFAVYASLLALILTIPRLQLILEATMSYNRDQPLPAILVPIRFAVAVLVYAFFGATMVLFPAIAVDAKDAGFRGALNDSKYDVIRILTAAVLGLLPIAIFQVILQYVYEIVLMWLQPYDPWQPALWQGAVIALPIVAGAAVLAALASYVYAGHARPQSVASTGH
jgi:hypothetical protein